MNPLNLNRYPRRPRELLQAWDAADELLIAYLTELAEADAGRFATQRILILNDSFGAIGCALEALHKGPVVAYTDSFLAAEGARRNSEGRIQSLSTLAEFQGEFDLVLLRLPKNLSFFEDELLSLRTHLKPGARLICGAMLKHLPKAAFELLEKYMGKTSASLAKKKARLIFSEFEPTPERLAFKSPYPLELRANELGDLGVKGLKLDKPFLNHSNLFSREKLDIGTRFLLENLPRDLGQSTVLDLGCGNGIVGIAVRALNPKARVVFTDESRMAVLSAEINYARYFKDGAAAFHWTHSFEKGESESVDGVVCNPPFHHGTTIGDHIATDMFQDAFRVLKPGGWLRVIGNSHLMYQSTLHKLFGNSELAARSAKFVVIDARKDP
jgi:23S rRNA (guanine1835-N2)-methyltransferase